MGSEAAQSPTASTGVCRALRTRLHRVYQQEQPEPGAASGVITGDPPVLGTHFALDHPPSAELPPNLLICPSTEGLPRLQISISTWQTRSIFCGLVLVEELGLKHVISGAEHHGGMS